MQSLYTIPDNVYSLTSHILWRHIDLLLGVPYLASSVPHHTSYAVASAVPFSGNREPRCFKSCSARLFAFFTSSINSIVGSSVYFTSKRLLRAPRITSFVIESRICRSLISS